MKANRQRSYDISGMLAAQDTGLILGPHHGDQVDAVSPVLCEIYDSFIAVRYASAEDRSDSTRARHSVLRETTMYGYKEKWLPLHKCSARQLLLVFPECLVEATWSWGIKFSTNSTEMLQHG